MQIAVIQHALRGDDQQDAVALGNAAADATDMGAEVVIFPRVAVLADQTAGDPVGRLFEAIGEAQSDQVAYINPSVMPDGVHFATLPHLGATVLLVGDACLDYQEILGASGKKPSVAILAAGAQSDLQAEAIAELALGLSSSLAGLVVIVEAAGAEPGDAGHGGSAIMHLGEVVAEAMSDGDDTLVGEFETPIVQPEPRGLLPQVPTILSARLAHHLGQKPDVDYPAELS